MLASRLSDLATQLKVLTPKQIIQRLPIELAQVAAGNTSKLNRASYIFFVSSKRNY